jgi:hypothetical protein
VAKKSSLISIDSDFARVHGDCEGLRMYVLLAVVVVEDKKE